MTDAPQSRVALSWREERTTDLMEQFIGIVRGRTVNSSRGRPALPAPAQAKPKPIDSGNARRRSASGKPGSGVSKNAGRGKPRRRT